ERVRASASKHADPETECGGREDHACKSETTAPCRWVRCEHRRRLHGTQDGVRKSETQRSGASGRLRIPSVVCHFDQESCNAAISSSTNRGDAFTRATTAPGTSPSSTSCSMRAKVSVN